MADARTKENIQRFGLFASEEAAPPSLREAVSLLEDLAGVFFQDKHCVPASNSNPVKTKSNFAPSKEHTDDFATIYRILAEQIPAVVFLAYLDEGFGEAYVSPHIETVLGFSQEEWLNDPVRWFRQLHAEDKDRWSMEAAQMFLSGVPLQSTYRVIARDGHTVWFQCDARMIRHDDGRPWLVHGVAFDVTELKESQEALRLDIAERQRLEQQLLQAQKMESIGALAGGIAHDFNNILNIILGYSALLMESAGDLSRVRQGLEVIRETAERGAALVQQLLTVARKAAIKFEPTDINTFLRHFAELMKETFPKEMNITLELDADVPRIMADPNRLTQALLNLCVNARDAMNGRGSLVLRDRTLAGAELKGRFREAAADHYVCVAVSDTGPGMDRQIRERIFDPFFTTKDPGRGTGLGLSAVYGIVKDHQGFIEVESQPGHGTTFRIYLPSGLTNDGESASAQAAQTPPEAVTEKRETILFVDDESRQVDLIRGFLERKGYRVLVARDGLDAVEIHRQNKDDIAAVILDMSLPKLSGWEAFLAMKRIHPELKTIFASGYVNPDQRAEMAREGAPVILQKPYLPSELLEQLRATLDKPAPVAAMDPPGISPRAP